MHATDAATLHDLRALSRADIEAYIADLETPLVRELAGLHERPLPRAEQRARLIEIRDERCALGHLRRMWREAHRSPQAGPTQYVG